MVELHGVHKSFGSTRVVHDVDLRAEAGETLILIGPSGCGKSTLLRLMLGLLQPDAGHVTFRGELLTPRTIRSVRRRIGYVIQDGGLFPHMTARGNVTLMARHLSWSRARIQERLSELTELTKFPTDGLGRYPVELSGGQRQRVALMRALMLDPEVLLLDEPLGALDPMVRFDLQDDLRRIFRSLGKTTVMVTHDLAEAAYFGDRIALMRDGAIVQRGSVRELVERPAEPFVARFFAAQHGHAALAGEKA